MRVVPMVGTLVYIESYPKVPKFLEGANHSSPLQGCELSDGWSVNFLLGVSVVYLRSRSIHRPCALSTGTSLEASLDIDPDNARVSPGMNNTPVFYSHCGARHLGSGPRQVNLDLTHPASLARRVNQYEPQPST